MFTHSRFGISFASLELLFSSYQGPRAIERRKMEIQVIKFIETDFTESSYSTKLGNPHSEYPANLFFTKKNRYHDYIKNGKERKEKSHDSTQS